MLHCKDLPRYHLLRFARTTRKETRGLAGKATRPSHTQNLHDFTCITGILLILFISTLVEMCLSPLEQPWSKEKIRHHFCDESIYGFCHFSSAFCSVVTVVFPTFPIILRYRFLCSCPACSVENDVVSTSDARRVEVARLQENLPAADPAEGVEMAQRVLQLLDEEGRGFFWQDGRTILTLEIT